MRTSSYLRSRGTVLLLWVLVSAACASRVPVREEAAGGQRDDRAPAVASPTEAEDLGEASPEQAPAPATTESTSAAPAPAPSPTVPRSAPSNAAGVQPRQPATGQQSASAAPAAPGPAPAAPGAAPAASSTQAPGPAAPTPQAPAATGPDSQGILKDRIKIGVLMPISGAVGFLGEAGLAGLRAYVGMANAEGGAHGRQYQLVVVDTQFEPSVEAVGARRLIDEEKVFAIYGVMGDSSAPYITSKGIPELALAVHPAPSSSKYPNIYPLCCNVIEMNAQWAHHLTQVLKVPIKSVGILYDTQNVPIEPWVSYLKKAWEIWGVEVKSTDRFNISDGDCTSLVIKMRNLNIDYWDVGQSLGWPLCEQAMGRQGWHPALGRGGEYTPDAFFVAQAGSTADKVWAENFGPQIAKNLGEPYPWHPSGKAPEVQRYVDSAKRYSPRNTDIRSLESAWMQLYWAGGKLLDEAIKAQTGAITWKGVNAWIQGQREWHSGLVGPHSFDPKCKGQPRGWVFQWQWDGKEMTQSDWKPYGGHWNMPTEAKNQIIPGAGDCLSTALADAVVK